MVNLYEVLGLNQNCSGVEIRRSIAKHQADGTMTEQQIKAVKAYLLDSENRAKYDLKLNESISNVENDDTTNNQMQNLEEPEIYQHEQYEPSTFLDKVIIFGFVSHAVFLMACFYKIYFYDSSLKYVGGDAYNFIINAGHATAYAVLSIGFALSSIGLMIYREVKK